jgi:hypothetical protein
MVLGDVIGLDDGIKGFFAVSSGAAGLGSLTIGKGVGTATTGLGAGKTARAAGLSDFPHIFQTTKAAIKITITAATHFLEDEGIRS